MLFFHTFTNPLFIYNIFTTYVVILYRVNSSRGRIFVSFWPSMNSKDLEPCWKHSSACIYYIIMPYLKHSNLSGLIKQNFTFCSCSKSYKCAYARVNVVPCSAQWLLAAPAEVHGHFHSWYKEYRLCIIVKHIFIVSE